jgi:hypothetical protein
MVQILADWLVDGRSSKLPTLKKLGLKSTDANFQTNLASDRPGDVEWMHRRRVAAWGL